MHIPCPYELDSTALLHIHIKPIMIAKKLLNLKNSNLHYNHSSLLRIEQQREKDFLNWIHIESFLLCFLLDSMQVTIP